MDHLIRAIRLLAGQCDGAKERDAVGFSAAHTNHGRLLALLNPSLWSEDDRTWATAILPHYQRQLATGGITLPAPSDRAVHQPAPPAPARAVVLTADEGTFLVTTAGNRALRTRLLQITGATTTRTPFAHVAVPSAMAGHLKAIIAASDLIVDPGAAARLATVAAINPPTVPSVPTHRIEPCGEGYRLIFPPRDTDLLTAVRTLPRHLRRFDGTNPSWMVLATPDGARALLPLLGRFDCPTEFQALITQCASMDEPESRSEAPWPDGDYTVTYADGRAWIACPYDDRLVTILRTAKDDQNTTTQKAWFDGPSKRWNWPISQRLMQLIADLTAATPRFWIDPQLT